MNLGFKIELSANIYKLPGRILTYSQLVDQILCNFKDRVPKKFKISYSSNDDSEFINICCESDFKSLLTCAQEKNMKNIKLKITDQSEEENILKDLDETAFNWCELIDCFDVDEISLNQQSQSLFCLEKSINNVESGFSQEDNNKVFRNELEEKLSQLQIIFEKEEQGNNEIPNESENICNKIDKLNNINEPTKQNTEKIINLDESAIIFIRSENYSPLTFFEQEEQSTENIKQNQQKSFITASQNSLNNLKCQKCQNSYTDLNQKSNWCPVCPKYCNLMKNENNQIQFFNKSNGEKLEQTKIPSSSQSSFSYNQALNQDLDNTQFQQAEFLQECNQISSNIPTQIAPSIPLTSHNIQLNPIISKCTTPSNNNNNNLSLRQNINQVGIQNFTEVQQNTILLQSNQYAQQESTSQNQSPINSQTYLPTTQQIMGQNNFQNFSYRNSQEEQIHNTTVNSTTVNEQIAFHHTNNRRKSKTTISHAPLSSKLTTSIYIDNGNQSTADLSQISFLNGSNQTNIGGVNSILSRKICKLGTQVPDQSFNQSNSQDINNIQHYTTFSSSRLPIFNNQLKMYHSQKPPQQQTFVQNEEILEGCQQKFLNIAQVFENTQNSSPENFIRENKERRHSYKISCQQVCNYRAKLLNSPKKIIEVISGSNFSLPFCFQNNGETQWPQNVVLRCIEGFNDGMCYAIESAQSSSTISSNIEITAPIQIGVQKNSYRLCYHLEDQQIKYFGPKVTFEIIISPNMEIDNQINCDDMKLNYQIHSEKINFTTQNTQQQLQKIVDLPQNSLFRNSQNQIDCSQILNQPNEIIDLDISSSTSPTKRQSLNINQNQSEFVDKSSQVQSQSMENVSEDKSNQNNKFEQFGNKQNINQYQLQFRRPINTN